jgi:hypothetical protein
MIKVLMERDLPAGFDVTDDTQASRHPLPKRRLESAR